MIIYFNQSIKFRKMKKVYLWLRKIMGMSNLLKVCFILLGFELGYFEIKIK